MFISGPLDALHKILARYRGTMLVSRQGSESAHGAGDCTEAMSVAR
jgi:triphosphoribosyl-dephospho-CoA synthetase